MIDYAELQCIGRNEILHPRWPAADSPYVLGYERDEEGNTLHDRPLLPDGVDQVAMDFYVSPRNFLQHVGLSDSALYEWRQDFGRVPEGAC